ncbi:SFXN2 protein, partial [Pseudoatta argentina]
MKGKDGDLGDKADKSRIDINKPLWSQDTYARKEPGDLQREDIIYAKKLRDSAFHPDNGEFMHVIGRMSFQLPASIALTIAMLTFYNLLIMIPSALAIFLQKKSELLKVYPEEYEIFRENMGKYPDKVYYNKGL